MHYNEALANKQGLTELEKVVLDNTYEELIFTLENPEKIDGVEDAVRELEFRLQRQWKFPEDPKFHRYQTHIKGCTCPRLDNAELIGYSADRYRVSDCPWHWNKELESKMTDALAERRKRYGA